MLIDETMQDRHLSYVQLSRHREKTEIFVDKATAGQQFERMTARMQRREEIRLAHDLWKRNLWEREESAVHVPQREPERERELFLASA